MQNYLPVKRRVKISRGKSLLKNLVHLHDKFYILCRNLLKILSFQKKSRTPFWRVIPPSIIFSLLKFSFKVIIQGGMNSAFFQQYVILTKWKCKDTLCVVNQKIVLLKYKCLTKKSTLWTTHSRNNPLSEQRTVGTTLYWTTYCRNRGVNYF